MKNVQIWYHQNRIVLCEAEPHPKIGKSVKLSCKTFTLLLLVKVLQVCITYE